MIIGIIAALLVSLIGWIGFERWRNKKVAQAMALAGSTAKAEREEAEAQTAERIAIEKAAIDDAEIKEAGANGKRRGLAAILGDKPSQ